MDNDFKNNIPKWLKTEEAKNKIEIQNIMDKNNLGLGESSSIVLAIEKMAEKKSSILIIDEKRGRKIAQNYGFDTTGMVAIIFKSFANGYIKDEKELKEIFDKMENNDFRLGKDLKRMINEMVEMKNIQPISLTGYKEVDCGDLSKIIKNIKKNKIRKYDRKSKS